MMKGINEGIWLSDPDSRHVDENRQWPERMGTMPFSRAGLEDFVRYFVRIFSGSLLVVDNQLFRAHGQLLYLGF